MSNINFWEDEEGEEIQQQESFESKGVDLPPIPKNTKVIQEVENVTIETYKDAAEIQYINIQWTVMRPDMYENRKVFQKIRIEGDDPTQKSYKEDKQAEKIRNAKLMLSAIDKICTGGKLFALKRMPTEEELQKYLIGKQIGALLQVYKIGDSEGNWVHSVFAPNGNVSAPSKAAPKKAAPKPVYGDDDSDLIPF